MSRNFPLISQRQLDANGTTGAVWNAEVDRELAVAPFPTSAPRFIRHPLAGIKSMDKVL